MKAIITKYVGPSNTRGSRVIASDEDGNKVTVGYDSALNSEQNHINAAVLLAKKMKWRGKMAFGHLKNNMVFVFIDDRTTMEGAGAEDEERGMSGRTSKAMRYRGHKVDAYEGEHHSGEYAWFPRVDGEPTGTAYPQEAQAISHAKKVVDAMKGD